MRNRIKDNRGSTLIEAAIYFPIILIMVVGMVVAAMYKLDKMMTQACMSERTNQTQSQLDVADKSSRIVYWSDETKQADINYYMDNTIFKWTNPTERQYICVNYRYINPILQMDYQVNNNISWLKNIKTNTTYSAIVVNNPIDVAYTQEIIKTFSEQTALGTVWEGKTGFTYEDYRKMRFGR